MSPASRPRSWKSIAAVGAVLAVLLVGTVVRMEDPLSSPVIPAEDPFTHMALVRAHLADGSLDPLTQEGVMYPPGLHAILATVWVYTGADLEDIFRFGPVVFGVIGMLGVAMLAWRFAGPVAGVVAGLAYGLSPELIFRTNMMSPTALDLAILPFFLYSVLEAVRGRLAFLAPTAALAVFLILGHPWVLAVMAPVVLGIIIMQFLFGRPEEGKAVFAILGMAGVLLAVGGAMGTAVSACYSQCGLGFQDISVSGATGLDQIGMIGAVTCMVAGGLLLLTRRAAARFHHRHAGHLPVAARLPLSLLALLVLAVVTYPAVQAGFPEHVDLQRMFGWPMLALGIVGFVATPLLAGSRFAGARAGFAGMAVAVVTYPFVIYNPLDSPFWPHRTAAYFGIGLVILAGVGAAALVAGTRALSQRLLPAGTASPSPGAPGAAGPRPRHTRTRVASIAMAAPMLVTVVLAGTVYAATPFEYEGGWYRLYAPCEYEEMQRVAARVDQDTVVITGDWRPKLVMAAFTDASGNVWYDEGFFSNPEHREDTVYGVDRSGREIVVVVDRHMRLERPDLDTTFLREGGWVEEEASCSGNGISEARLHVYRWEGTA